MNVYLDSAVKRYELGMKEDFLITPISRIDAEITVEVIEILKKLGDTGSVEILKKFKNLKDEEIRDQLMQYNMDLSSKNLGDKLQEEGRKGRKRNFINIQGIRMELGYIHSWQKKDRYNEVEKRMDFGVIINKVDADTDKILLESNIFIPFQYEINRNEYLVKLDSILSENFNIINAI